MLIQPLDKVADTVFSGGWLFCGLDRKCALRLIGLPFDKLRVNLFDDTFLEVLG